MSRRRELGRVKRSISDLSIHTDGFSSQCEEMGTNDMNPPTTVAQHRIVPPSSSQEDDRTPSFLGIPAKHHSFSKMESKELLHPPPLRPRRPRTKLQRVFDLFLLVSLVYLQWTLWSRISSDAAVAIESFALSSDFQTVVDELPNGEQVVYDGSDLYAPQDIANKNAKVVLQPTLGQHTNTHDAVFGIADGVPLPQLVLFVTTLRESGFKGDIVLSVSARDKLTNETWSFLEYHAQHRMVVYEGVGLYSQKRVRRRGDKGIKYVETINAVTLTGLYMDAKKEEKLIDPRKARPMDTARYEVS